MVYSFEDVVVMLETLPLEAETALLQKISQSVKAGAEEWRLACRGLAAMETGSIGHAKSARLPSAKDLMEAYRKLGYAPPEIHYDPGTQTQTVKQPTIVQEIKLNVVLDAPQESEADRIMRITREMACG